jgi:hypothetical protein
VEFMIGKLFHILSFLEDNEELFSVHLCVGGLGWLCRRPIC